MDGIFQCFLSIHLLPVIPHTLAYIDPGTGSIIIQSLIAAVAGAAIVAKLYWDRLLKFFGLRKNIKSDPSSQNDEPTETMTEHGPESEH